ncbi:MAG: hypothetical protein ACRCTE_00830 [Cellulosilyticaceae bacterium]
MEEMLMALEQVRELLEQILGITQNQMTVLLEGQHNDECLDMVEQMAQLKGDLTTQMEQSEAQFQQLYGMHKDQIVGAQVVSFFQERIGTVLSLKDQIIAAEQKNVLLLQELLRKYVERVAIPKNPQQVTEAYQKQKK